MPSEQKALHRIANKARDINKRAETKVAKQQVWVDGQRELCESSEFNAFELKKNFLGRLRSFGLNPNDGTYNIKIAIHPDNTNYREFYDDTQNQVIQTDVEKNIFKSDIYDLRPGGIKEIKLKKKLFKKQEFAYVEIGDLVRFSGYFSRKGNRKPNCFKQRGIGLFYNKWAFEFNSIEKIPVREY